MNTIEDSLREMFAAQVRTPPPTGDLTGTALRRGRALRLRRTATSSVAAAVALVLTVVGVNALRGWEQFGQGVDHRAAPAFNPEPLWTAPPGVAQPVSTADNGIGLDVRVGDRIWTTDGRQLRLAGVGQVSRVYRVADGWVYGGAQQVRLLRTDGSSVSLSGEEDRWVVNTDGTRIAFAVGTDLYIARLSANGMAVQIAVAIPAQSRPVALLPADRVVLSAGDQGHALLDTARPGTLVWQAELATVFPSRADVLTGLVRRNDGRTCLAELRPVDGRLRAGRTGCPDKLAQPGAVTAGRELSPDGAWLAVPGASGLSLINVARSFQGRETVVACPVVGTVAPRWADAGTLVTGDSQAILRCRTDGRQQLVSLPAGVGGNWALVPGLTGDGAAK